MNRPSLLKKYEDNAVVKYNVDKLQKAIEELSIYVEKYDTDLYDKVLTDMLDNLTEETFNKLLYAVNLKLLWGAEDKYNVTDIYSTVSKTKKISFKQLKCFAAFLKLIKLKNNKTKQF